MEHESAAAHWVLLFHLLGAFCFVGGAIVAAVAYEAARRRGRPAETAVLLRLTRAGVLLVVAGGLLVLAMGLWLLDLHEIGYGRAWTVAVLSLFTLAVVLGGVGGGRPKRARLLAERLAESGEEETPELRRLLDDRLALLVNYASGAIVVAIVVLMVWHPE